MTDPIPPGQSKGASPLFLREAEIRRGIELLHFGYSYLNRAVDNRLARQGLGRAHQRALYFIARQPGLTISDLLKHLAITKQSLGRVINDLVESNMVETSQGRTDRRQKRLRLTGAGAAFEADLFDDLRAKLAHAYGEAGQSAVSGFWKVLEGLIPEDEMADVAALQHGD